MIKVRRKNNFTYLLRTLPLGSLDKYLRRTAPALPSTFQDCISRSQRQHLDRHHSGCWHPCHPPWCCNARQGTHYIRRHPRSKKTSQFDKLYKRSVSRRLGTVPLDTFCKSHTQTVWLGRCTCQKDSRCRWTVPSHFVSFPPHNPCRMFGLLDLGQFLPNTYNSCRLSVGLLLRCIFQCCMLCRQRHPQRRCKDHCHKLCTRPCPPRSGTFQLDTTSDRCMDTY